MKKSKGKGFDARLFFLNHGEKLGAGFIALLALMGIVSASWSPAARTPEEMVDIANKTKVKMESSQWPETDMELFRKTPDVVELARRMQAPNEDVEQFTNSVPFNEPLNRLKEKRTSVVVLAPVAPEQTAISVPIAMVDLEEDEEVKEEKAPVKGRKKDAKTESEEDKERRERLGPAAGNLAGGNPFGQPGLGGPGLGSGDLAGGGYGLPGAGLGLAGGMGAASGGYPGDMTGMGEMGTGYGDAYGDMYGGYGDMLGTAVKEKRIQFAAGVSVRMIFQLREQRKIIADALHIPVTDPRVAAYAEDFIDLHIERKQAIPARDIWSGEWETLPSEDVAEILQESIGSDLEIVNPLVTRPVITMPLPRRASGKWSEDVASHKQIREFVLSADEQEIIRKRDEKLAKEAEERQARLPPQRAARKGFSAFKGSATDLMAGLGYGAGQDFNTGFLENYGSEMYGDGAGAMGLNPGGAMTPGFGAAGPGGKKKSKKEQEAELEKLRKKLFEPDATNRLLLVRFIDFTAERGQQYIYRVRLEMANPNFRVPVDDLMQPELSSQPTITSDWSAPTAPVLVPSEYRYYVTRVTASAQSDEKADLSMYYEVIDKGSPVMADITVPVGVRIGGEKEIDVVDLSKSVLDRTKIDFRSRDLLCAVSEAPRLLPGEHPDLKSYLDKVPRGQRPVADQITVIASSGSLVSRLSGDALREEQRDKGDAAFVIKEYEKIGWRKKDGSDPSQFNPYGDTGEMGGMYGDGGMGMGMGYGDPLSGSGSGGRKSSRRNR